MDFTELRRPLYVFALVFFFVTLALLGTDEQYGLQVMAVAAVMLLLILCVPLLRRIAVLVVITCAVLLSSATVYTRYFLTVLPLEKLDNTTALATVRVTTLPKGNSKLYHASVMESDVLPVGTRLCVSFADPDTAPTRYDTIAGEISLYLPSSEQQYLHGDDIFLLGYFGEKAEITAGDAKWYERTADTLRKKMLSGMHTALPGAEGDLLAGVCLGETASLSESVQEDFRRSGLSHLLVVSGLHMTVLAGAIMGLLRFLKVRRGVAFVITLLLLWLFMLMVGLGYSVIRAAVMLLFVLAGQMMRVRADARTSLATALLLIVVQNPYAVQDVGFLLSFAATLGLIMLTPLASKLCAAAPFLSTHPFARKCVLVFCTPLAALAFTAPILAYAFGTMSVLSPISNVLTVWPSTIMMCSGLAGAVLYCIPAVSTLCEGFFFVGGLLAKWILWAAAKIADLSIAQLQIRHGVILILLVAVPIAVYWSFKLLGVCGVRRALVTGVVLILACVSALTVFSRKTVLVRIAAEDTLAAVIETGGQAMAIISGETYAACTAARYFLVACGVDTLDALIITDGDASVTAALAGLLEAVPAETVIYPAGEVDLAAGIADIRRETVEDTAAFTLWNDLTILVQDGWWRLEIGDTHLLLAPADGNVKTLPADWRQTHLAVFSGGVPKSVSLLETRRVVMVCEPQNVRYVTGDLLWGKYPIHLTATDGEMILCTTGSGDMVTADSYYL